MAYEYPHTDSITGVIGKIVDDVRELFREEVALARAELRQEIGGLRTIAAQFAGGAAAAGFATFFLLLGIAQGFAMLVGWPAWAGYLAMAVVLGAAAFFAIRSGRKRVRTVPAIPQRTVATLKETKEWIQDRMTSEHR